MSSAACSRTVAFLASVLMMSAAAPAWAAKAENPDRVVAEPDPVACSADPESSTLDPAGGGGGRSGKKPPPSWVGGTWPLPPAVKPGNPGNDPNIVIDKLKGVLGLTCSLNVVLTDSDIQRPAGNNGTDGSSSTGDPGSWSGTSVNPDGSCTCNLVFERNTYVCLSSDQRKNKVAHELCHCLQAQRGEAGKYDPKTGKWGTGTSTSDQNEWGADACAADVAAGKPPKTTFIKDKPLQATKATD